ncbi:MAG: TerB family tellurite resistance protein [Bacteroidales bacterium]|nr:TerB family tellurite resistance protein [Bacteroidales bacterium]
MQFTDNELKAIFKIAKAMVLVDGRVDKRELMEMADEMRRLGVSREKIEELSLTTKEMDNTEALITISTLDDEKKIYVSSYLIMIMIVDGEMHEKEMILWEMTTALCGLPEVNVSDAIALMSSDLR